jgi:hypothetical protein
LVFPSCSPQGWGLRFFGFFGVPLMFPTRMGFEIFWVFWCSAHMPHKDGVWDFLGFLVFPSCSPQRWGLIFWVFRCSPHVPHKDGVWDFLGFLVFPSCSPRGWGLRFFGVFGVPLMFPTRMGFEIFWVFWCSPQVPHKDGVSDLLGF